jgi:hypothetical protein
VLTTLRRYAVPALALVGLAAGLTAQYLLKVPEAARLILLVTLLAGGLPVVVGTVWGMLRRKFAADIVATLAIVGAAVTGEYLAGCVIVLMQTGGEAPRPSEPQRRAVWSSIAVRTFSRVPARRGDAGLAAALRGRGLTRRGDDSATVSSPRPLLSPNRTRLGPGASDSDRAPECGTRRRDVSVRWRVLLLGKTIAQHDGRAQPLIGISTTRGGHRARVARQRHMQRGLVRATHTAGRGRQSAIDVLCKPATAADNTYALHRQPPCIRNVG